MSNPTPVPWEKYRGVGFDFFATRPFVRGPWAFGVQLPASSSRCFGSDNQINAGSHLLNFCVWVLVYLGDLMRCGVSVKRRRPRGLCLRLRDRGVAALARVDFLADHAAGQQG